MAAAPDGPDAPEGPETPPPPSGESGDGGGGGLPSTPTEPRRINCETRAAAAEALAERLSAELTQVRAELETARQSAAEADLARELQRLLIQARAIDLDAATLLAQRNLDGQASPDISAAVRELRRRKPHLFRAAPPSTSMSPRLADAGGEADELAELAAATGDRRALLRYLRARRTS